MRLLLYSLFCVALVGGEMQSVCDTGKSEFVLNPTAEALIINLIAMRRAGINGESCGEPQPSTIPSYEAARWALSLLNQDSGEVNGNTVNDSYIPGIKIGMRVLDTCSRTEVAVRGVMSSFPDFSSNLRSCTVGGKLMLGLLGPTLSSSTKSIADWLYKYKIPQVSSSALSGDLNNKDEYPYFMRTVADTVHQNKVIAQLLVRLQWKFIAVVYSDDDYGRESAQELIRAATANDICVATSLVVPAGAGDAELRRVLNDLIRSQVVGVVFTGSQTTTLTQLGLLAVNLPAAGRLQWVIAGLMLGTSVPYFRGHIAVTIAARRIPEFEDHLMRIDENNPLEDPWYQDWYMSTNGCKLAGINYQPYANLPNCILKSEDQKRREYVQDPYALTAVDAIFTFARALKTARDVKCPNTTRGSCDALKAMTTDDFFFNFMKNVNFIYGKAERIPSWSSYLEEPYLRPKSLAFQPNGDLLNATYDIWNMNNRINSIDYTMVKVGVFQDEQLSVALSDLRFYDIYRNLALSPNPTSLCPSSGCGICIRDRGTQFLYIPGAILLNGLYSVHNSNRSIVCGGINAAGAQLIEAFAFAVSSVKSFLNILPGVELGAVGLDYCQLPNIASSLVSDIHGGTQKLRSADGMLINIDAVHAYIAADDSPASMTVADTLGPMKMTQISYGSSSASLTDANKYPYVLRTPPSDGKQAKAMIEILKRFRWTFVQAVHSADSFGREGMDEFIKLAEIEGICVIASFEIGTDGSPLSIVQNLQANPQAKVVITIAQEYRSLLQAIRDAKAGGQFLLLAAANWGTDVATVQGLEDVATGTISLKWRTPLIQQFIQYLDSLDVLTNQRNPWYKEYYQYLYQCNLHANTTGGNNPCNVSAKISQAAGFMLNTESYYTINAVLAAAKGLDGALREICGASYNSLCPEFDSALNRDDTIFRNVRDTQFVDYSNFAFKFYDREGDGLYEIYNYNGSQYMQLGNYTFSSNQLILDTNQMTYYAGAPILSECVTGVACETCLSKFAIKFLHVVGDVYLGGFFNLHYPGRNVYSCGEMKDFNGFQFTEAMAWAVDQINSGVAPVKLSGVKLGAIGLDECSNSFYAQSLLTSIHSGSLILSRNGTAVQQSNIRSWLSYGSEMSVGVSQVLSALLINHISPSATVSALNNAAAFPVFYRTVPSDDKQVTAMARLATKMGWTCVQTVHEPSMYGRGAVIDFKAAARVEKLCVSSCYELITDGSYDDIIQKLSQSQTRAVIVFARSDLYARQLLAAKSANSNASGIIFIASESWGNLKSVIKGQEAAAEGFITFKVNSPIVDAFNTYMSTLQAGNNNRNPWFDEFYQHLYQCNLPDNYKYQQSCTNAAATPVTLNADYEQENWVLTTIDAVYAFTYALDAVLRDICGAGYIGVCQAFLVDSSVNGKILSKFQNVTFMSARGSTFAFNGRSANTGYTIYRVLNKNYVQIGSYENDTLLITDNDLLTKYSIASQCAPCIECPFGQDVLSEQQFSFMEGDVIIAGMFDVHLAGEQPFSCGALNNKYGAQLVEVFNFAIEQVNKKTGIFQDKLKGVTLGGITLDSCQSSVRAASLLAGFHSGRTTLRTADGQVVDPNRIQVWIGGYSTSVSIEMANILGILGLPQVSYGSTGFELSDRQKYPHFLRTVPADDKQVRGLISFLKFWNFVNVQVVVSPGSYTQEMAAEFHRLAQINGICESKRIDVAGNQPTSNTTDWILAQLLQNKDASVIVALIDGPFIHQLVLALANNPATNGKFFLIGTNAWTNHRDEMIDIPDSVLAHTIYFSIETADVPEFDMYLDGKLPDNNNRNPWFGEYYENIWQCTLAGNVISYPKTCVNTDISIVRAQNYSQDPLALYVINAVYAAAMGVHNSLLRVCGENFNGLCADFRTSGEKSREILNGMLNASFIDDTKQPFQFVLNGESNRGYHLYTMSRAADLTQSLQYKNVGSYNDSQLLKMDIRYNTNWNSDCSGGSCAVCPALVPRLSRYMQVKQDRDIGMVSFLDVHNSGNNYLGCGPIDLAYGFPQLLSFFYGLYLINSNADSKLDTTMKISGLVIDECKDYDRLRQDLYTYQNGEGLCNYASYKDLIYPWTVVSYIVQTTAMTVVANDYLRPLNLTAISPYATASKLNDKSIYPYFLRTVPPDFLQAAAMVDILETFNWNYALAVYSDSDYGFMGVSNIMDIVNKKQTVCIANRIRISAGATIDEALEVVKKLDSYKYVRAVILFTFTQEARIILQATQQLGLVGRFTWIGGDDWANRDLVVKGLEDVARGAITIQLRSEPVIGYRNWIKELSLNNRKGIPNDWFEEYWQTIHSCRLPSSIVSQTQYARECDETDIITDSMIVEEPSILHNIIITYVTAWGLSSVPDCFGQSIDDCLWRLSNEKKRQLIYDAIRSAQWDVLPNDLGGNSFKFKFTEDGYGDIGYTILNYRRKGSSTTEYQYVKIGSWLERLQLIPSPYVGYSPLGDEVTVPLPSTCPTNYNCTCLAGSVTRSTTDALQGLLPPPELAERLQLPYGIVLAMLSGFGAFAAIVLFFYFMIFYPVRGGTSVLGYMLLIGIFFIYMLNYAFLLHARDATCGIRRFCFGVSHAVAIASMLVKVLNTWRTETYAEYQAPYQKLSHPFWLLTIAVGIAMVQVIIDVEWLILVQPAYTFINYNGQLYPLCSPPDMFYTSLVQSVIYVMFLILLTSFFAALTWRSEENSGESRWILVANFFVAVCWIIWAIIVIVGPMRYQDTATVIANLFTATIILLSIYVRKFYLLQKYSKEEEKEEIYSSVYSHRVSRRDDASNAVIEAGRSQDSKF